MLATPPKQGLPAVGNRIPLLAGRMPDNVRELAEGNPAFVNGKSWAPSHVLEHGDIIDISRGFVFRYCEHEDPKVRAPPLEAAIGDAPHDDTRWRVYADWLIERGEGLGQRMACGPDEGVDDARWLGPMARPWAAGNLELTWSHGFIRTATFRSLEWENSPDTYWCMLRLFELEVARFLQTLHVDLFTTHLPSERPPFEARARRILENLRDAPRTLREVTLGPVRSLVITPDLKRELARLREERPQLVTTEQTLVKLFQKVRLRGMDGDVIEVTEQGTLRRFGLESLMFSLTAQEIAWVEPSGDERFASPFKVNGHSLRRARLMHGDIVEPAPGLRYVVEVS